MPDTGAPDLAGEHHLLPKYDNLGTTRPLGPGEYIKNTDGSWSNEYSTTVQLGDKWSVVPTLWLKNGKPTILTEDQAADTAKQSGLTFQSFPDESAAEAFSQQRENKWQQIPMGRSDMQPPLWSRSKMPDDTAPDLATLRRQLPKPSAGAGTTATPDLATLRGRLTRPAEEGSQADASPLSSLWQSLKSYGAESTAALSEGARQLPGEVGGFVSDIGQALLPTRAGAEAGGRVVGKLGDVGAFLSGGGAGPTLPPSGRGIQGVPRTPGQQTLQDFERLRMTPSVPAITQNRPVAPLVRGARALPFSPVEQGLGQRARQEAGEAAERFAAQQGAAQTPEQAGNIAQNAVNRFAADKTQAATDYNEFDRLMHGAPPAPMTRTLQLLNDLRGRFPNAPELGGLFTNPKFSSMRSALTPRVEVTPPEVSGILDASGRPIVTRPEMQTQRGGDLSMPEIKELRSQVGYLIEHPQYGPENIPKAQLRSLYGAMTNDMRAAAAQRGPAAIKALTRATINYGIRQRVMERLEPLIKPDAPETAFARLNTAAQSTGSADAQLLKTAKDIMRPDEWNDIGSAMIRRLGFPQGIERADTLGSDFALSAFDRNWKRMSGRAKDLFFGEDAPGTTRNGLETLARVARNKALGPRAGAAGSSLGRMALESTVVEAVLRSAVTGKLPMAELGGIGGAYGLSKLMMSPRFARWLYQLPQTIQAVPGAEGVPRAQATLQAAMAAAADDRRREAERADLRNRAYVANRRGDLSEVERLSSQRRKLGLGTPPPAPGF
jgi:hypothetical protein